MQTVLAIHRKICILLKDEIYEMLYSSFFCETLLVPLYPQVEEVMCQSLREVTAKAIEAYPKTPRRDWVVSWPGQVVLASSTVHWTAEVTQVNA